MRTIWKFPLAVTDSQVLLLPTGAHMLAVQTQHECPCLWAMVNSDAERESVVIRIHGTGHELPLDASHYKYIGTFQIGVGDLVFHAFRVMGMGEMLGEAFGGILR